MTRINVKSIRKVTVNQVTTLVGILFALLCAFSFYQVLNWNLFPWLKLSIIFGSSFLCLIFALIVKIQESVIKYLILTTAFIQLLISAIMLSQHEMLRTNWQWMFFPLSGIFSMIFWDLFSRKINQVSFFGRIACSILLILTFLKFLYSFQWIDYSLICLVLLMSLILLFTKSKVFQEI
jgi:hypothetical protein